MNRIKAGARKPQGARWGECDKCGTRYNIDPRYWPQKRVGQKCSPDCPGTIVDEAKK